MKTQPIKRGKKVAFVSILVLMLLLSVFVSPAGAGRPARSVTANGTGLRAEYFNLDGTPYLFNNQPLVIVGEGPINHSSDCDAATTYQGVCGALWGGAFAPFGFSFQEVLTGYLEAPVSGTYTFLGTIDDYMQLSLNGETVLVDTFLPLPYSFTTTLTAGELYPLTITFQNHVGGAALNLSWILPGAAAAEIVPRQYLYLPNTPPVANAGGPYTVNEGSPLVLDGSGSLDQENNISTYEWDLDGDLVYDDAAGVQTTLTITDERVFVVGLKVTDTYGASQTSSATVTVLNIPPQIDAGLGATLAEGGIFTRNGVFTDPGADTWSATVDYGTGGGAQPLILNPDKTFTLGNLYPDNGLFLVNVCVSDDDQGASCAIIQVTVSNVAPMPQIAPTSAVDAAGVLSGGGSFVDPGADSWTATVDYGDASGLQPLVLTPAKTFTLAHTYTTSGDYTVSVCVSDDEAGQGCAQLPVRVQLPVTGQPPVAVLEGSSSGREGWLIILDASKSSDPDGSIVSYAWDFDNDGIFDDASGKRVKYFAVDDGVFPVAVKVTDNSGLSSVAAATLTIENRRPYLLYIELDRKVKVREKFSVKAFFMDAGKNDTFTVTWDWGDGTTTTSSVESRSVRARHAYSRPGKYVITITVTDNAGDSDSKTRIIQVVEKDKRDWHHDHDDHDHDWDEYEDD